MLNLRKQKPRNSEHSAIVFVLILIAIALFSNKIVLAECADLDGDGVINQADESIIKEQWHKEVSCCNKIKCGDINCNGFVDIDDLLFWSKRTSTRTECSDDYALFVEVVSSTSKVISAQLSDNVFTIELDSPEGVLGTTTLRTNDKPVKVNVNDRQFAQCDELNSQCWIYEDNLITLYYQFPKAKVNVFFKDINFILVASFIAVLSLIIIVLLILNRPIKSGNIEPAKKKKQVVIFPHVNRGSFNPQNGK